MSPEPAIRSKRKLVVLGLIIFLLAIVGTIGFFTLNSQHPPQQLINIAEEVNFPIYYPSELPAGYSFMDNSAKYQSGFLYYKLHKGNKIISITQQPIPAAAVNLQKLPRYSSLSVPAGPAALGVSVGNPSAVIATGSTLVNINSSKGVSKDDVVAIAKHIKMLGLNRLPNG